MNEPWRLLFLLCCALIAHSEPFRIGLNNTKERMDYRDSVSRWILASGASMEIISDLADPTLTGYWGLHIKDFSTFRRFHVNQTINSIPGIRKLFGDKDGLIRLQRHALYELGADDFSPPGYLLPEERAEFGVSQI
jgi:hypothetical protein